MDAGLIDTEHKKNDMKIAVLGKGMVGKSSLTYNYINYNTPKDHDPTIEDKYSTVVNIDGTSCEIEILDTAGQDDYQSLMNYWISFGEAFVLVYAINDRETFESLKEKRDKILKMKKDEYCPIILVGNKSDLESQRLVSEKEGSELANSWGCKFLETSVYKNVNCKEVFNILAKSLLTKKNNDKNNIKTKKSDGCCEKCVMF